MRYRKKGRKFGRERNQRAALMKSLASSFFMLGRIRTTEAKAKELRPYVEKLITRAKNQDLNNRRMLRELFGNAALKRVFENALLHKERMGGYTRIIKMGPRARDAAKMAILELVR